VLSVVVPVHQGREHLPRVLDALAMSELPRESWELIVVDDASTDGSAEIAAGQADLVIRLTGGPRGPAYARNRGFEAARGSVVAFVDADVLVHPRALPRLLEVIRGDPGIGAVIGTYDDGRTSGRLLSEYRNLLRHVEHQIHGGETDAFQAGLALVRSDAFARAGMFDEWHFPRPQAEALELGDRLRALGYRIVRCLDAQATHLKRWTLWHWLGVDLLERGMSVARLAPHAGSHARAGRLYLAGAFDALVAWTAVTTLALGAWRGSAPIILLAALLTGLLVVHNGRLFAALARARGASFAAAAIPLHVVTCAVYGIASATGRVLYHTVGEPQPDPVIQAFAEVGVRTWPPVPAPRSPARPEGAQAHPNGTGGDQGAHMVPSEP
jgi:glycosyltransferase involved in cell wall biosynthesis